MTDLLPQFARLVADSFQDIVKGASVFVADIVKGASVFVADIDGDELWAKYLASFPDGADPDEATAKLRAENKKERERLLEILAEKQAGKLSELSEKELQKRIAALET